MSVPLPDDLALDGAALEPPLIAASPYVGWTPDWRLAGLDGVAAVEWFGPPRLDPIGTLLGIEATAVEFGAVTFAMPWTDWGVGPDGELQPGIVAVLADHTHAGGVFTTFEPMQGLATVDLFVSFVERPRREGGDLSCSVEALAPDEEGGLAFSTGTVRDASGRLLAQSTARCFVFSIPGEPPDHEEVERPDASEIWSRAPSRRPVTGEVLDRERRDRIDSLQMLRELASGQLPAPPVYHLTGQRPVRAEPGETVFAMVATPWLSSFTMNVQGGALAQLAAATAAGAVDTTLNGSRRSRLVELRIQFIQAVQAQGQPILATAAVTHRGRSVAFSACDLYSAEGARLACATATHSI